MLEGTHDGNLITNQSYVGEPFAEVSGKVYIKTQFKNYLGEPINPTKAVIEIQGYYGQNQFTITGGEVIVVGHRGGGSVKVTSHIDNNEIYFTFENTQATATIDSLGTIEYLELETQDRTYNEFKFEN